jgi:hypothetical protein
VTGSDHPIPDTTLVWLANPSALPHMARRRGQPQSARSRSTATSGWSWSSGRERYWRWRRAPVLVGADLDLTRRVFVPRARLRSATPVSRSHGVGGRQLDGTTRNATVPATEMPGH